VRSRSLYGTLSAFAEDVAACLAADRAEGAELPFDVVETGRPARGGTPLYCYRPMTGEFILARLDRLRALETYLPALRSLAAIEGLARYLRSQGRRGIPADRRSCAELALFVFLSEVFEDATEFEIPKDRLDRVYGRLESAVFAEVSHTSLVGVVPGVEIESPEVLLGAGLALVRPEAIDDGPPDELLAGSEDEGSVLAVLSVEAAPGDPGTVEEGRQVLRGLVEALQLFGDACVVLDQLGWIRVDEGTWHATPLGREAPVRGLLRITELQEDELRAFCSLVSRRAPRGGQLAWSLARFRMGCERHSRWETLTDHVLALRALLEPEGPHTARLAGRLAALCAMPEERPALAQRTVDVLALERAVIEGLEPRDALAEQLADELTSHLRALLRDVICGHLDPDLAALADGLIAQDAAQRFEDVVEAEQTVDQSNAVDPDPDLHGTGSRVDGTDPELEEAPEELTVDEMAEESPPGADEFVPADDEFVPADDEFVPADDEFVPAGEDFEPTEEGLGYEADEDLAQHEGHDHVAQEPEPDPDPAMEEESPPEEPVGDAPDDSTVDEGSDDSPGEEEHAGPEAQPKRRASRPARKSTRARAPVSRSRSGS
jgi:hypothetical protein